MLIEHWAQQWGIPPEALADLRNRLLPPIYPSVDSSNSEAAVSKRVQLEASQRGYRLWRNNVGMATGPHGTAVRFGLANSSAAMNKRVKSSDLIGIGPDGRFLSREIKPPGWVYSGTPRERAQLRWLEIIVALGGDGQFATGVGTL